MNNILSRAALIAAIPLFSAAAQITSSQVRTYNGDWSSISFSSTTAGNQKTLRAVFIFRGKRGWTRNANVNNQYGTVPSVPAPGIPQVEALGGSPQFHYDPGHDSLTVGTSSFPIPRAGRVLVVLVDGVESNTRVTTFREIAAPPAVPAGKNGEARLPRSWWAALKADKQIAPFVEAGLER